MSKLEFLESELSWYIALFDKESTKHKKLSRRFRYWTFFLTAAATILSGFAVASMEPYPEYREVLGLVMLSITSALTLIHSLEGLRQPGELWRLERTILYRLKDIRRDLRFQSADPHTPPDPDALYEQIQACLQSSIEHWNGLVGKKPAASEPPARENSSLL